MQHKFISLALFFISSPALAADFCNSLQKEFTEKLSEKISSGVPVTLISSFFNKQEVSTCETTIRVKYNLWTEKYDINYEQKNISLELAQVQKQFCEFIACSEALKSSDKYRLFFNPITRERLLKIQKLIAGNNKSIFSLSPDVPNYSEVLKTAIIEISLKDTK